MSIGKRESLISLSFLGNMALLFCLFAPSAWMITHVPPLWRDADGYNQVAQDPLLATYWGHAPAYCYLSRLPILLGEQLERHWMESGTQRDPPGSLQPTQTHLTDTGVWLLIIAQHMMLGLAAWFFIITISQFFGVRFFLSLLWASNALFYAFAHCIGSETLSLIAVILLATLGLRLVRCSSEPRWSIWYSYAVALCICFLSRHINIWLIVLLPVALALSALARTRERSTFFVHAVTAFAIGLGTLILGNHFTDQLAKKSPYHLHSRIGYSFLWRLQFLSNLSPESRTTFLQKMAARTNATDVRKLVALLDQIHAENQELSAGPFMRSALPVLFALEDQDQWEKLDHALNRMAYTFLIPPPPELLQVASIDFRRALSAPVTEISNHLFRATAYYFQHPDEMPGCADLITFRAYDSNQIPQLPIQYSYFRLWSRFNYWNALIVWFVGLILLAASARNKQNAVIGPVVAFAFTLNLIGLLMVFSACLLVGFLPRYGMPMWQSLILSIWIVAGTTADLIVTTQSSRRGSFAAP